MFRLAFAALLVGVSIWGIFLCHELMRTSFGPGALAVDSSYINVAAWMAWTVLFGPLAVAVVVMARSTLRKTGALDQFAFWLWDRAGRPDALLVKAGQSNAIGPRGERSDPHGLESLTPETVERLQRAGSRAATVLGGLVGAFWLAIGIFGLVYLLFFSRSSAGSSVHTSLAVRLGTLSGLLVFLGLVILQRTFRRDNNSWLFPLSVFTQVIVRRRLGERARLGEQHLPDKKQPPRV
jgi:hypothetical protein